MRAYVEPIPPTLSKGIWRVADALARYAPPDVEIVPDQADADLVVLHVIGQEGWVPYFDQMQARDQRRAVFQYCVATTTTPRPYLWRNFWTHSEVVASYYDLRTAWREDPETAGWATPNFLRVPLGVDTTVFRPTLIEAYTGAEHYAVGTSGYVAGTECVGEWAEVCAGRSLRQFHLGPNLNLPGKVDYGISLTDRDLAAYWSSCRFVSGLRRSEGFELPAFEGLACGARPVMFAREDAIHWMGDAAEYLQEGSFDDVVAQLEALVQREPRPVTAEEIRWVGETFSWERMAERFWQAVPR